MRAIYGVSMQAEQITHEEATRLRQILAQHDAERQPFRTIDLNNPPREPYHFQKFPKMVYDHQHSVPGNLVIATVRSDDELAQALEDGWSENAPAFGDSPDDSLSPKYQAEAESIQNEIDIKRRPGRPRKIA